jgi:YD repeat-containing protein
MKLPARILSFTACFALFNVSVPFGAVAVFGVPLRQRMEHYAKLRDIENKRHVVTHPMSKSEQAHTFGRTGQCPYIAGQNKWDDIYKNVNLVSGNYSMSVTDLSFDGAFGIPCNVTRSYSVNDANEGPFGPGWELSADVRNTAGGILKSPAAPVRSVPTTFKERNAQEVDPNIAVQPAAAVTATDAGGKAETIQKDVDGVLTTPPWDTNLNTPTYQFTTFKGATYQVENTCVTTTVDGTTYTYAVEGSYVNGTLPWNAAQMSPAPSPQPANVLKVVSVVDRQGNTTNYTYDQNHTVTFNKVDGQTTEHPLSSVSIEGAQTINFTCNYSINRVTSVTDGTRTVSYGYDSNNNLNQVTDPASLVTYYTYGSAGVPQGWGGDTATNLLVSIKGLVENRPVFLNRE